jgi:hypothetical protein
MWAADENYLVLLVCAAAGLLLLGGGLFVMSDTWLALVAGRVVAASGPPSTDALTAWTLGRHWVDQQWLGQLMLYETWRAGGLVLLALLHAVVVLVTFILTLVGARRRGGSSRHVAIVGLLALLPIGIVVGNIRTQTFALPLFLAVFWLLAQESRGSSNRVFWCVPLLILWANIHGSVILGAALVGLAGAIGAVTAVRTKWRTQLVRSIVLVFGACAALVATPYGFAVFGYFRDLFSNDAVTQISPEWMATTFSVAHIPFFILGGLALALIGRDPARLTVFERVALVVLLIAALSAVRNLVWFSLAVLLVLPALLTARRPLTRASPPPRLAAGVAALAIAGAVIAAIAGVRGVDRQVESRYPVAAGAIIAGAAAHDPDLKLFVHGALADWLLFRYPKLAGRIPFDIRFELLTEAELQRFHRVRDQIGADWLGGLGGARLVVLDSTEKPLGVLPPTTAVLLRERGTRELYARHHLSVILRPGGAQQ